MSFVNNCEKCDDFDKKTKELVKEFLSIDEIALVIFMCSGQIRTCKTALSEIRKTEPDNMAKRLIIKRQEDITTQMVSKFFCALDEKELKQVHDVVKNRFGMEFKINNEKCPHQDDPKGDSVA